MIKTIVNPGSVARFLIALSHMTNRYALPPIMAVHKEPKITFWILVSSFARKIFVIVIRVR